MFDLICRGPRRALGERARNDDVGLNRNETGTSISTRMPLNLTFYFNFIIVYIIYLIRLY